MPKSGQPSLHRSGIGKEIVEHDRRVIEKLLDYAHVQRPVILPVTARLVTPTLTPIRGITKWEVLT
jgi:hypothetical protein